MGIGTALAVGGSILGGVLSNKAAKKSAKAQGKAAEESAEVQRYMYDQTREDQGPYREIGYDALDALRQLSGLPNADGSPSSGGWERFLDTPDYKWSLQEGQNALNRGLAARGLSHSGRAMKEAIRYGQGAASQQFGNVWNRFSGLAGTGQTSVNQLNAAGQNYANAAGNAAIARGDARASGYINSANALNNVINQGAQAYGYYNSPYGYGRESAQHERLS